MVLIDLEKDTRDFQREMAIIISKGAPGKTLKRENPVLPASLKPAERKQPCY